ncbi:MAG: hypothetical protein JWL69_3818 [Phycisphaerales bacterium]|nr:hypothetical protein [Phycisphaerales bacterium]
MQSAKPAKKPRNAGGIGAEPNYRIVLVKNPLVLCICPSLHFSPLRPLRLRASAFIFLLVLRCIMPALKETR